MLTVLIPILFLYSSKCDLDLSMPINGCGKMKTLDSDGRYFRLKIASDNTSSVTAADASQGH